MHTVHYWWLKTGEYACPVFDIVDIFCELPDLQACRVHELCPESFRNREFVQNFCKLQIHRHGGARGGRWANKKHFKCEMQSLNKLEAYAREKCAGRCDVTNTERSPQTLPQSQKPSRSLTRAHALARREHFLRQRPDEVSIGKSRHCRRAGLARPKVYGAIPRS